MIRPLLINTNRSVEVGSIMQYKHATKFHNELSFSTGDIVINRNPEVQSSNDFLVHKCLLLVDTIAPLKVNDWFLSEKGNLEALTCRWERECGIDVIKKRGAVKVIQSSHPNHEIIRIDENWIQKLIEFYNEFKQLPIEVEIDKLAVDIFMKEDELFRRAISIAPRNWESIGILMKFAESKGIKEKLGYIMNEKYHRDEFLVGLL